MRYYRRIKMRNEKMFQDYKDAMKSGMRQEAAFERAAFGGEVKVYHAKRVIRSLAVAELQRFQRTGELPHAEMHEAYVAAVQMGAAGHYEGTTVVMAEQPSSITATEAPSTEEGAVGMAREARQLMAAIRNRVPALCIGETGTGKTTIVKRVGSELNREVVRVNLDGGVTPDEIIGRYQAKAVDGVTVTYFQEGVVPRAMRSGAILLLDELNAALPDTLFCLHSLLEAEPRLFIPETQEEIVPAEGFAIVATMNPSHDYAGTKGLNAALYSRFGMVVRFEPLTGSALRKAILTHVPKVEGSTVLDRICRIIEVVARLRKEEKVSTRLTLREGIAAAKFVAEGDLTEHEAVDAALLAKLEPYEKDAVLAGGGR